MKLYTEHFLLGAMDHIDAPIRLPKYITSLCVSKASK